MYQNGIEFMHRKKEMMTGIGGCVHREGGGLFILEKRRLKKDKLTSSEQRGGAVENASQPSPFSLQQKKGNFSGQHQDRACFQTQEDFMICKCDQTVERAVARSFGVL